VLSLLRQAVDVDRQTVVMVTHDPIAASYADRVVFLADGLIADDVAAPGVNAIAERLVWLGNTTTPTGSGSIAPGGPRW
jgi:putative ABC transport system ATP-binding protein